MKKFIPLVASGALLLAGCTPASPQTTPTHGPVDHARQTRKPTPPPLRSAPAGSADQFVSIIGKDEQTWRAYEANIDACNKAAEGRTPDDYIQSMECIKNAQMAAASARNDITAFLALGSPPPELAVLVTETLNALAPLSESKAASFCQDAFSDLCASAVDRIDQSAATLVEVLDEWAPYKQPG